MLPSNINPLHHILASLYSNHCKSLILTGDYYDETI